MKKTIIALTLVLFILSLAVAVFAVEEIYVTGKVEAYSTDSITVQNDDGSFTFTIDENTEIAGDIKDGVEVELDADDNMAVSIVVIE